MNIKELKSVLNAMIAQKKLSDTPMIWGPHGIGKSSVVRQVAAENGYRCLSMILSQKEAVDVAGMLYTYRDEELGISVTGNNPPEWFADAMKHGKVILFFDEFNQARRDVMSAAFELVLDRRLNNHVLPDDVFIVCAGNPQDDRYDVNRMSEALIDRFVHLHALPDVNAWLEWADGAGGVSKDVVDFIKAQPAAAFHRDERDRDFPVNVRPSVRAWQRVGRLIDLKVPANLMFELVRGCVGVEYAASFTALRSSRIMPLTAEEILGFGAPERDRMAAFLDPSRMRIDLATQSANHLIEFAKKDKVRVSERIASVVQFIEMLPDDLCVSVVKQLNPMSDLWSAKMLESSTISTKLTKVRAIVRN